jgi:hypothetical protein
LPTSVGVSSPAEVFLLPLTLDAPDAAETGFKAMMNGEADVVVNNRAEAAKRSARRLAESAF